MRSLGSRPSSPSVRSAGLPALLLLGALLAGCADEPTGSSASDAEPAAPSSSTLSPSSPAGAASPGTVEPDDVTIVSATAAGGQVATGPATELADDEAVQEFGRQFRNDGLVAKISRVAARTDPPVGTTLYAAVVAVGCDVPTGVVVTSSDAGVVITAEPSKPSTVQCLAAVTTVALVLVADQ